VAAHRQPFVQRTQCFTIGRPAAKLPSSQYGRQRKIRLWWVGSSSTQRRPALPPDGHAPESSCFWANRGLKRDIPTRLAAAAEGGLLPSSNLEVQFLCGGPTAPSRAGLGLGRRRRVDGVSHSAYRGSSPRTARKNVDWISRVIGPISPLADEAVVDNRGPA